MKINIIDTINFYSLNLQDFCYTKLRAYAFMIKLSVRFIAVMSSTYYFYSCVLESMISLFI